MVVALVTSSTQGVGPAIALRLADDGFDVAVNDLPSRVRNLEALACKIALKGRKSCTVLGDASSEADVQEMISSTVEELGSLDVVRRLFFRRVLGLLIVAQDGRQRGCVYNEKYIVSTSAWAVYRGPGSLIIVQRLRKNGTG